MTGQETSPLKNSHDSGPWAHSLHLATLFGFAVAQPLFDQIGRHPEFLVAQGIGRAGLLPFSLGLALALPLCAWGALVLLNTLSRQLETATAVLLVGLLSGVLALQAFSRTITAPGPLLVTEAVGVGLGVGWFYLRVPGLRYFLTALSPSLFIFPAVFLLGSPLLNRGSDPGEIAGVGTSTPVVMVVFDELPAISLLGPGGQIDPVRYPNLAALTREAHWFRNASTVSEGTLISVPAILDGLYPEPGSNRLPIWSDHPRSLFTLLRDSHHLNIHENITRLAPPGASTQKLNPAILLSDLKLIFLHQLLPSDLSAQLPPITQSWKDFAVAAEKGPTQWTDFKADWLVRGKQFEDFIHSIKVLDRPGFHFLHSMLPHASWKYLPDGRLYTMYEKPGIAGVVGRNEGVDVTRWLEDDWPATQAYKRHLLQVSYVDKLVGDLVAHLKEQGRYEQTLLVVTSDQGAAFLPGDSPRKITSSNYPAILSVPLIVKEPFQEKGRVHDRNVETIDILPTILDILEIDVPWQLDGASALGGQPERPLKVAFSDQGKRFTFDARLAAREKFLESKLDLFGSGDWSTLFEAGPYPGLVGKEVAGLGIGRARGNDPLLTVDGGNFFRNVKLDSSFLLCLVRGQLELMGEHRSPFYVAIAVNGVIRSTTRTSPALEGNRLFTGLVDPGSFQDGSNRVEVFLIEGSRNRPNLRRSRRRDSPLLLEMTEEGDELLVFESGGTSPFQEGAIKGWVVGAETETPDRFLVGGWVVDQRERSLVSSVVALVNEQVVATGRTQFDRPEAVKMFENPALLPSGFRLEFHLPDNVAPRQARVRVLAVSAGVAGELHYPRDIRHWPFSPETAGIDFTPVYTWGDILTFGPNGSVLPYLREGWGQPVEGMHWSLGEQARLHLAVQGARGPVVLEAFFKPFLAPGQLDSQRIRIYADGRKVGEWLASEDTFRTYRLAIPAHSMPEPETVSLEFRTPDAAAPAALGAGPDSRVLGLAMIWIRLSRTS